jgi:hypothetical protein
MEWIQHLNGDQFAALVIFVVMTGFAVIAMLIAYDWRRRYRVLREYADKVAAQNDELRRIIADTRRKDADASEPSDETVEGRGPNTTLH